MDCVNIPIDYSFIVINVSKKMNIKQSKSWFLSFEFINYLMIMNENKKKVSQRNNLEICEFRYIETLMCYTH